MDIQSRPVITYRWIVFLLAAGYTLYNLATRDYSFPGGPFRFLTIWALLLSFASASYMLALSEKRRHGSYMVLAMCASVMNVMVVFLYWKLYFTDPALVQGSGALHPLQEYYLHVLGPALQIIDALFIACAFRKPLRAIPWLLSLVAAYILWIELFVQRFNTHPPGNVTSGLPYPFLNNMDFPARAAFYGGYTGMALAILAVFAGIGWALQKSTKSAKSAS